MFTIISFFQRLIKGMRAGGVGKFFKNQQAGEDDYSVLESIRQSSFHSSPIVQSILIILLFIYFLVGPAERLFGESFYVLMKNALKEDGLLCVQGACRAFPY